MADERHRAYHTAVRLLGRREHSVAELRSKIRHKHRDLDQPTLEHLLETLQQDRLLSDERYAEVAIRSRIRRGYGPKYIEQELMSKGVSSELVESVMEQTMLDQAYDWVQLAADQISRRHPHTAQDSAAWLKAARFLARRGYPSNLVMQVLGEQPPGETHQ